MANAVLVVGWNQPKAGREGAALELFTQALGVYAKWEKDGKIESYEPVLVDPHGGDLNGFIVVRGDRAKLDALRSSEEMLDLNARSMHLVEGFGVVTGWVGEGLQKQLGRWQKHIPSR
jgi:hypothetical protein